MKIYMDDLHIPINTDELKSVDDNFRLFNAMALMRKMKSVCQTTTKFLEQVKTSDLPCGSDEILQIKNNLRRIIAEVDGFCK